ncbi:MAG: hypothetical protein GX286_04635 [Clostridiales bacterium]|jgi:cytoskeletal protein CcmA (bactofilin family)|nr:hypothetical protein [Clostridiales bacterium]
MKKFKSLLTSIITVALILIMPAFATSADTYSLPYVIFASGTDEAIQLNAQAISVNGQMLSNGSVEIDGTWVNINGQIIAKQGVDTEEMLDLYSDMVVLERFLMCDTLALLIPVDLIVEDTNIDYNFSMIIKGMAELTGNVALNESLIARDNVVINGNVINKNGCVLGSQEGDVIITNDNVNLNCFVYAPNGTVIINSDYVNINGVIMAERVIINSKVINLNYNGAIENYVNGN